MSDEEAIDGDLDSSFPESLRAVGSEFETSFSDVVKSRPAKRFTAVPRLNATGYPCSKCGKILKTERGLKSHLKLHRVKDASAHHITTSELKDVSEDLAKKVLDSMVRLEVDGLPGKAVQECCVSILLLQDSAEWKALVGEVFDHIILNCLPQKFSSPTALCSEIKVKVQNLLSNDTFTASFLDRFRTLGLSTKVCTIGQFLGMFMRRFANEITEVLICTLRRPKMGSSSIEKQPLTSKQKSLYHRVAGCAVKTLLRRGHKLKGSSPKWTRVVNCLLTCFKDSDLDANSQPEAHQWTALVDRGGLTYVGEKALEFFYLCGSIAAEVQPPSRYKFFEQIYQCNQLVYLWEGLTSDMLPADESSWLMENLCRLFYNTYCIGYCKKC